MSDFCDTCAVDLEGDTLAARPTPARRKPGALAAPTTNKVLYTPEWYVKRQVLNAQRYFSGLQAIELDAFGSGPAVPSPAHIRAANKLINEVREVLSRDVAELSGIGRAAWQSQGETGLTRFLATKDKVYARTREAERLLAFYRGIFQQRSGLFGNNLLAIDRIARDCYQAVWLGLGKARSIPAPPPFAYVEDGKGPATYRRGVLLSALGRRPNPFPLVKIPQHRLQNPWTLGAIPHEVAHNVQNDLGMWKRLPRRIRSAMAGKIPDEAVEIWARWHKESFADFAGVLLIGPAYVESLIDVVGKARRKAASFNPDGAHPTPIVRVPMNCALLRRIGFADEARSFERVWRRLYPNALQRTLPEPFRETLPVGMKLMVDACCFTRETAYGDKTLAEVVPFVSKNDTIIREGAERLARGENTGVLPERLLIAAARRAVRSALASPSVVSRNFYAALSR